MSNQIDYTKMRLGTVTHIYQNNKTGVMHKTKIEKCEKCGRKGEPGSLEPRNGKLFVQWTHSGHVVGVAGIQFFHVDDYCGLTKVDPLFCGPVKLAEVQ